MSLKLELVLSHQEFM